MQIDKCTWFFWHCAQKTFNLPYDYNLCLNTVLLPWFTARQSCTIKHLLQTLQSLLTSNALHVNKVIIWGFFFPGKLVLLSTGGKKAFCFAAATVPLRLVVKKKKKKSLCIKGDRLANNKAILLGFSELHRSSKHNFL